MRPRERAPCRLRGGLSVKRQYQEGFAAGALTVSTIVAIALAVAYVRRVDLILWGLKRERAAIQRDPLGRVLSYLED